MSWWHALIIGSAATAINVLAVVVKSPEGKKRYYNTAVAIWQSAKALQATMLLDNPGDPNFQ